MRKRTMPRAAALLLCIGISSIFCGCSGAIQAPAATPGSTGGGEAAPSLKAESFLAAKEIAFDYSERDISGAWDDAAAVRVTLSGSTAHIDGEGANITDGKLIITQAGVYVFSGTLNGNVVVEASKNDKVQLVLDGAHITAEYGPAIYIAQADKAFVTLMPNSENSLRDGEQYALPEGEDEPNAALFSKDDLTINGTGKLTVTGNYNHGIACKDELVIANATLTVTAANDGLKGKDCVALYAPVILIDAGGDGIQSNNDTDENKGFIAVDGGAYTITAGNDCMQAATTMQINDGVFTLSAADDGLHADGDMIVYGGTIAIATCEEGIEGATVSVHGGSIDISAKDDGINACGIAKETEKTDAAAQTADVSPGFGGRGKGGDIFENDATAQIWISGGSIDIRADGDGVDSNGALYVTGGDIRISGPENSGNACLDYGGTASITGGTLIAAGARGMQVNFGSTSTQCTALIDINETRPAGTALSLLDAAGNTIAEYTPRCAYSCVIVSVPGMQIKKAYTLFCGEAEAASLTLDAVVYGGTGGMGGGQRPEGGMPGQRPKMPKGEAPEGMPEFPEGGAPDGMQPPALPAV